jgi:hypothetical protein
MTNPITGQNKVEWQVMAYGALGDAGAWSAVSVFYTIGVPADPVITDVSNSNKPVVTFTAPGALSWEMEFLQGTGLIYYTNNQPYTGGSYQAGGLFLNGAYTVRMRSANQYGLKSGWAYYNFIIDTVPPAPLKLEISKSLDIFARLYFGNPNNMSVFIHRAEIKGKTQPGQMAYKRIAAVNADTYDDYTVAPGREYAYFIRAVNPNFSFADSNTARFSAAFRQTVIAPASDMKNALHLVMAAGGPPEKSGSHGIEKTFTLFAGRKNPVVQLGDHISRSLAYSFYCAGDERETLEEYSESGETLIIRDWRFGTVYGQIDGEITSAPVPGLGGASVSFTVRQSDYPGEAALQ